ncbi:DNA-binding transcriptional regulator, LysR family [Burkholderia sp. CF099]|nr:DNA-binding transcriptional regulator, LysR family [Burkholderia sp. CF099]
MRKNLDNGVLHAMRAFVCVVDAGSFSQAAEQLQLTTAQVSRLVAELEKRLQAKLLHRTTRQRSLTDVGAAYLERCREILDLVNEAEAHASGTAVVPGGCLRVQCMANFGQHYVSPLLPGFFQEYPSIRVEYSTSQYAPDLLGRGTDVSLYLAEKLEDSRLVSRRLGTTFSVLCASVSYLDKSGLPQTPAELSGHACLQAINPSVSPNWVLVTKDGLTHELTPEGPFIADTPDVLRDAAEAGVGIALLPLFTVIDGIRKGRLVHVLPTWRSPDIGVFALMPSRHFRDAKTRAWLKFVDERLVPAIERDARFFETSRR